MAITEAGRKALDLEAFAQRGQKTQESVDAILGDNLRVRATELHEAQEEQLQDARKELLDLDRARVEIVRQIAYLRSRVGAAPEARELV